MHHLTPFNVAERLLSKANAASPEQNCSAEVAGQTPRRRKSPGSDLLIWPHKGNANFEQTSDVHTSRDLISAFSPAPSTASRDWQDVCDLPAMLKTPEAPRRLSTLFCSTQQRRISLGPVFDAHDTTKATHTPSQQATHLYDQLNNGITPSTDTPADQQHASNPIPKSDYAKSDCKAAVWVDDMPTQLYAPAHPTNETTCWTEQLMYTQDPVPEKENVTAEHYIQPRPADQIALELIPTAHSTSPGHRCNTTQAETQLAFLLNARKWLQSSDISISSHRLLLVLSYLAHADLTHGQIMESQIAIAIEDLRQHTDSDVQRAAEYCTSKWQLLQRQHEQSVLHQYMGMQRQHE